MQYIEKPLISVIVPVYNGEKYIERCLTSITNQTYSNLEIIVIDDGSSDSTASIVLNFSKYHKNILFVQQAKNKGVSHARNLGLSLANGIYISFVDSDDMLLNTFHEELYLSMQKTHSELACCGRIEIKSTGERTQKFEISGNKIKSARKGDDSYLKLGGLFVWDKLYKKEIIDNFNIKFNENIKFAEDFLFLFFYKINISKASFVHKYLYLYTEDRKDSARNSNNDILDIVDAMHIIIEKIYVLDLNNKDRFINDIGDIAVGYYVRRINSFIKENHPNTKEFISKYLYFLKSYIPHWRKKITCYRSKNLLFFKLINNYRTSYICINILSKVYSLCKFVTSLLR